MSVRLSCPTCNTAFALPALPADGRAACPRCGDVFPVRSYTEEAAAAPNYPGATPAADRTRGEGRRMVGVILAALVLVLLAGLPPFIVHWRGKKKLPGDAPPTLTAKPPAQLTALGYLCNDCNVVFAVQPGPLLHHAERTKQEPRDVLAQAGLPDVLRSAVDQIGVPLAQIDHLAGGVALGDDEDNALRLTLVLVLKQPLADEDEFLKKLDAKSVAGKKDRHSVKVGKLPLLLARVSPTVWALSLNEKGFDAIDKGDPAPGGAQFRDGVKAMVAAVPPDAAVWFAADDDRDWTQKPAVKLVGQSAEAKKWLPAIKDGRGGMLAVSLGDQPHLRLNVRAADAATAARVRTYFAESASEVMSASSGGSGAFAQFDAPFDANTGKLLQKMLSDAGK